MIRETLWEILGQRSIHLYGKRNSDYTFYTVAHIYNSSIALLIYRIKLTRHRVGGVVHHI